MYIHNEQFVKSIKQHVNSKLAPVNLLLLVNPVFETQINAAPHRG